MKKNIRGISLLEVVVVIAVITVLIGLSVPASRFIRNRSLDVEASAEIKQLDSALMAFFADNGYFPSSGQMLACLDSKYFTFDNARIQGTKYNDPWGNPYFYRSPGSITLKGYDLYSIGSLMVNKQTILLGQILQVLSTSSSAENTNVDTINGTYSDIVIGNPAGIDSKTIWGLPEPSYDLLVMAMLSLLRATDTGYNLDTKINIANIPIDWADLSAYGALALYDTEDHEILLDISLQDGPIQATTAILAHEATHLSDHLANNEQYFDSVQEEYDAFYNSVKVWEQMRKPSESNWLTDYMDFLELLIYSGEELAKDVIRQAYYYLPEDEEYGDGYVVPKRLE